MHMTKQDICLTIKKLAQILDNNLLIRQVARQNFKIKTKDTCPMAPYTKTESQTQTLEQVREIPIRKISLTLRTPEVISRNEKKTLINKDSVIRESSEKASKLAFYQGIIFYTLYAGYAFYTYARKIFSYAAPTIIGLGMLSQSQVGLFISGCTAIAVPFSSDVKFWTFLWFINGLGQGCGWPACSKLLKKWFNQKQFGTYWSMLSTSSNLSGAVGPMFAAFFFVWIGWRACFIVSGMITVVLAVASLLLLRDSPIDLNLDSPCPEDDLPLAEEKKLKEGTEKDSAEGKYSQLIRSPLLWIISICYLVVFGTKTALSDWGQVFLMKELQQTQMQASTFNSALEAGDCYYYYGDIFRSFSIRSYKTIFGIVASESFPSSISGASHAVVLICKLSEPSLLVGHLVHFL
ncbi:Glucose-6-phosphate exchanger SLC37A4 [Armadillidium vulgare]|nr:Glucose-6-phosphate exchanger SLC37A4 [Armadillidium vulgare]